MLKVTKTERINSRLMGLEFWAYKLRLTPDYHPESMRKGVRLMQEWTDDLWVLINTDEEKGKKLGWWE